MNIKDIENFIDKIKNINNDKVVFLGSRFIK
jgi:cystathionine beta-lyase family protein involved in aluminum resistance